MKSIVICGSSQFASEVMEFIAGLRHLGITVYEPEFYRVRGGDWSRLSEYDKRFVAAGLTYGHFNKIRLADVVFIYNKDGHIGKSTGMEIGYAVAHAKPIYAFSDKENDLRTAILFQAIISTPATLAALLR